MTINNKNNHLMKSSLTTMNAASAAALSPQTPPPAPQPQPELLTQAQMAQRIGITRRTLHSWTVNGVVPMLKVRGYCRFEPAKVWAALLQNEVSALPSASAMRRVLAPATAPDAPESSSREGGPGTADDQGAESGNCPDRPDTTHSTPEGAQIA